MWQQTLEEQMETVRRKMEEMALTLGLNHPKVYQLSQELDQLHNQWELERRNERRYRLHLHTSQTNEHTDEKIYRII